MNFLEAVQYVGGGTIEEWRLGVDLQFKVLQGVGMSSQSSILEVGAGCLGLAHKLVEFLAPGNYTGIEPNAEVAQAGGILNPGREPLLLHREDFDPAETGRTFDIVFAHSVLTHAAGWQLPLFLRNIRPHLRPGGSSWPRCVGGRTRTHPSGSIPKRCGSPKRPSSGWPPKKDSRFKHGRRSGSGVRRGCPGCSTTGPCSGRSDLPRRR